LSTCLSISFLASGECLYGLCLIGVAVPVSIVCFMFKYA